MFEANLPLFEQMYERYLADPQSVTQEWRALFEEQMRPTLPTPKPKVVSDQRIQELIDAYRTHGHLGAHVNPLQKRPPLPAVLDPTTYGFTEADRLRQFSDGGTLDEIVQRLQRTYMGQMGIEYVEGVDPAITHWIQQQIEPTYFEPQLSMEQKQMILEQLNKSDLFEGFIHTRYTGQKRFSLEGAETLIPMLQGAIEEGAKQGGEEFILGMAHRGRLNVLSNILNKSYTNIFSEFEEGYIPDSFEGSGDVKYHKGFFGTIQTVAGKQIRIELVPNPSHLESINPVVEGYVKAKQIAARDMLLSKVIPILIHGDAAISGQGVVYETLQMNQLEGYSTGGTLHFIVNNQIGFTTLPQDSRSTHYCTDIAKTFGAPVFHVNAEDPEGAVFATLLAMQIRQKFHIDVFIELNCYRKYGHNEGDEPAFTQPLEYKLIRAKKPIRELYRDTLIHQGVVEKAMAEGLETAFKRALAQAQKGGKIPGISVSTSLQKSDIFASIQTGVSENELQQIAAKINEVPPHFHLHPKLDNLLKGRMAMARGERPVDWGMAEMLAYGSLLWQRNAVRLAGQDSGRGTFSHRHALWMDQEVEKEYFSLQHLCEGQGRCDMINSPLSEFAALGFEFGYSVAAPEGLTVWEAQFGDFANGAQTILDEYLTTAEQKWGQKSPLTLLLPHGYEGQGPDHSSGRIERFLQLAGNDNIVICNPTNPAQLFHLLRRQVLRSLKKPLVVFTPKGLLRLPACVSPVQSLSQGTFQEFLDDPSKPRNPHKLLFCSGRIYYDLEELRTKEKVENVAILRIEQLYPLHLDKLKTLLNGYSQIQEAVYVQEEPSNMGAWSFLQSPLQSLLPEGVPLQYIGRSRSAAPAAGSYGLHRKENAAILERVFSKDKPTIFDIAHHLRA